MTTLVRVNCTTLEYVRFVDRLVDRIVKCPAGYPLNQAKVENFRSDPAGFIAAESA